MLKPVDKLLIMWLLIVTLIVLGIAVSVPMWR